MERKTGHYYTVGNKKHMMLLGSYKGQGSIQFAKQVKDRKKRQGYTVATRKISNGTEVYIRQD